MLNLDCDSHYADVMELAFYNGALSGLSRDGTHYFYENPLESSGDHHRWTWHPAVLPDERRASDRLGRRLFYSVGDDLLAVHMYGGSSANVTLGGKAIRSVRRRTIPWPATWRSRSKPTSRRSSSCGSVSRDGRAATLAVNGARADARTINGYLALRRRWSSGDQVRLSLPMPVERIRAHPDVKMDRRGAP